jgi:hypothetical protein
VIFGGEANVEQEGSPKSKLLINETLPDQFLYDLGAYLQTCAHIEITACDFICAIEGFRPQSEGWKQRFHKLRKVKTSDLIPILRKCSESLPDPMPSQFREFVEWIDRYSINRHIAVHGAFFNSEEDGYLRVLYTHKVRNGSDFDYVPEESKIDRGLVLEILNDADRLLRILTGLVSAIDKGEVTLKN